jgi:hypothetical protein
MQRKKFMTLPHGVNEINPMFVEGKVRYSALFTDLVGWHAGTVSFPPSDIILGQLAYPSTNIE